MKRVCTGIRIWKTSSKTSLSRWERVGVRASDRTMPYTHLNPYELTAIIRPTMRFTNQSLPRRV
ncbi:hypothetical protein B9Q36_17085 [Enterobacter hormaechei]|nr:hypothetical protein AM429_22555 [Enterobacter cloacae complex sp.]PJD19447.1 hypothetical protein B9Q26_22930 [Enterobacter hormaechei]PJD33493.1 hypothetical protein B9Q36_17085 [Enterobacter hormaechei]